MRRRFAKISDPKTLRGHGGEGVFAWIALIPTLALVAVVAMGLVAGGTWRASLPASLGAGACGAAFAPTIVKVNEGSSITIGGADGYSYNDLRARGAWLDDRL